MSIEVRVPALPESVADATILSWHKRPGEAVIRGESLVDLETDKVVLEVPAPADGVLGEVFVKDGDTVQADALLAVLGDGSAEQDTPSARVERPAFAPAAAQAPAPGGEPVLTPAVRRLIKEFNLDPRDIHGTGRDGRILKSDVMSYLDAREPSETDQELSALAPVQEGAAGMAAAPAGARPEQRVPMTRLRARIAERLVQAQHNAAILTTFNEVNLQAVQDLRRKYQDRFEKEHDIRIGFMSFFVKAVVEALKRFPVVNASVDGSDVVYHGYYDIGIAVGSPRGLVVPILRDADQLSFAEIEKAIKAFGQKAQDGTLSYDELSGGTFTISNGGVYGSMLSTPILNPPQSGILGMHNVVDRPVVENGQIVIRPMMYVALSYDHRIIDGREAVSFLVAVKQTLEDPARLLLQI